MNSFNKLFLSACLVWLCCSSVLLAASPPNLLNWWAADGNTLDSAGTNHAQTVGLVSYAPSVASQGFNLAGTNGGYVDVGSLSGLQGAQGFTVMAWLNIRRFTASQGAGFVGSWDSAAASNSMFLLSDAGQLFGRRGALSLAFADATSVSIYGSTALPTNQWVHFAATWRSSDGTMAVYKNGRREQTGTNGLGKALNFTTNYTAKIGELGRVIDPTRRPDAIIDEVQLYNRALDSNEIATLYAAAALPQLTSTPVEHSVYPGTPLALSATFSGLSPICFLWRKDGLDLSAWNCVTNGAAQFNLPSVQPVDAGAYTLVLSNSAGVVESPVATIQVLAVTDLAITTQLTNQVIPINDNVALSVNCVGPGPYYYQWRLNGVVIPGETNAVLAISNFQSFNAGEYTFVVYNDVTSLISDPALLSVPMPTLTMSDSFAAQVVLTDPSGAGSALNTAATKEPAEPAHAGKFSSHSVWISWSSPVAGIATFSTRGSAFDTLLAVYTGDALETLQPVTSDDDSGGFLTSTVRFNVQPGTLYRIAVDGLGYASGDILLTWNFTATANVLPQIISQPPNQTAAPGEPVVLSVPALGEGLTFRWFRNGVFLTAGSANSLILPSADENTIGVYIVEITKGTLSVTSQPIRVEMNLTGTDKQDVRFTDKFIDRLYSELPLRLGSDVSEPLPNQLRAAGVLRGYSGAQVFSTYGAQSEPDEPHHCNVVGGASMWFSYYAEQNGTMYLNTDGSTFDTILAVYTGPGTDFASLSRVACDNNSGTNGRTSSLHFTAVRGTTYYVVVDGVKAATGTVRLHYSLVMPAQLASLGPDPTGAQRLRVTGRAGMRFTIQATTNLRTWTPLLTTNTPSGVYDYLDHGSITNPSRIYRALMLP